MESHKEVIKEEIIWSIMIIILFLICAMLTSCSTPKTTPYSAVVEMPNKDLKNGRILFNNHCATCHPEGLSGLGLAIINKPLPKGLIKFQIRNGIGVMPAFDEKKISDDQVENIAEYLLYLRRENREN